MLTESDRNAFCHWDELSKGKGNTYERPENADHLVQPPPGEVEIFHQPANHQNYPFYHVIITPSQFQRGPSNRIIWL